MKTHALLLTCTLFLAACKDDEKIEIIPQTAEEMYAKAETLLKPNVEGAASDFEGALHWTRRAAEAGYLKAQTDLAGLYLEGGKGIEKDLKEAYRWFKQAAEQGSTQSYYFMGNILYQGGEGIAKNMDEALRYWAKAAEAGLPEAQAALGHYYVQAAESVVQGIEFLKQAAMMGIARASLDLGYIYAKGCFTIEKDMDEAIKWYKKAAEAGNTKALVIIALMSYNGEYLPKNQEQALNYFRLSAGQDYVPAIKLLISALKQQDDEQLIQEAHAWERRLTELEEKEKVGKPTESSK